MCFQGESCASSTERSNETFRSSKHKRTGKQIDYDKVLNISYYEMALDSAQETLKTILTWLTNDGYVSMIGQVPSKASLQFFNTKGEVSTELCWSYNLLGVSSQRFSYISDSGRGIKVKWT